ncbi:threonine-phosphate decarboxylase CobD [Commensalibacter communis]|uniref:threonine-phosphate decarboxylase CobD n=1 Tax=Commensalibacter communis TaxID=2972786 RepID=UPI0022FF7F92|nr:threonine-phosphate decarboxylase CobD [Commensalibacter communis]CAI3950122.1 Histidinol-phosphate/aromatic aminotransferase or cobyric acid decarboxylase (HisC) (PDB:4R2N) [Commensalibacter communis]CAI3955584.1 Histidinol-phosphate/aromatic aminotransferase or cobyric acid decarboxylase (HisC) (PDB:4R2N) [Commensalibacter communis]
MIHGGQLQEAKQQFPESVLPWIDLSTGINPYAYPFLSISTERWTELPSVHDELKLRKIAAHCYGVKDERYVIAAPGTQILISLLPYIFKAKQVCILCPTYMEHVNSWQQAGIPVHQVASLEELMKFASQDQVVGVICNPNNPDGRLFSKSQLQDIANYWAQFKNHLIIDEAFVDFEGEGAGSLLPHPALTILRSFGKTYGLPGVRLGFLLSNLDRIERVRQMLGPWAVSGAALQIGLQALQDRSWFLQSQRQLSLQAKQLDQLFLTHQCQIVGGTHLFRLIEYPKAQTLWKYLASQGIWVRKFEYNAHWLRFGLPHKQQWGRVQKTIRNYFSAG